MKVAFSKKNIWDRLPLPAKTAAGFILGAIPTQYLIGRDFRKNIRFLQESQWWSAEQYQAYQLKQLHRILTLAYDRTQYYKRTFSASGFEIGDLKDLETIKQLPLIDRGTIDSHLDEMLTIQSSNYTVDYVTTAGTSGKPLRFYTTAHRSLMEYPIMVSGWKRVGYDLKTPLAVFRGRLVAKNRNGLFHEYDPLLKYHHYSNFHMNDLNMRQYIDHVRTIGPCYLHVYPSSIDILRRFIQRNGISPPENIKGIIAESENVYPEQRSKAEKVFGVRYYSSYGQSEKVVFAAECEKSTNYHVWPTYGFFELLDDQGNSVTTPGERGEIVGTGFINNVVPFIRYRTGDYATYVGNKCNECGREHPIISDIRGHNIQESLVALDRSLITWSAVNMHDDTYNNIEQFQFYQDTPGYAVLQIVPAIGFNEDNKNLIQHNLGKKFNGQLEFTIKIVETIPKTKSGKAIFVDQHVFISQ